MARHKFFTNLRVVLFGLILLSAVSCRKSISLFKPAASSDTAYANTDQRLLAWEYKKREREYRKQQRHTSRLTKTRNSKEIDKVIRTARSYRGTPYKYGGTTRIGMDCSGLLCTSYKSINVNLPRSSNEQSHFGKTISLNRLQPGDLVFFSASANSRQISHVGLVTDVKGNDAVYFIHASTRLGVIEDNLFSAHYKRIFLKAIRPNI